jgi:hypothetical protein
MPEFKTWITKFKTENPTLAPFVTKLDKFFSDSGFSGVSFEKAVATGLNDIEKKTTQSFTNNDDAEGK